MSASPIFPAPSTAIRRSSTAMPNAMQPGARAVARSVRGRRTRDEPRAQPSRRISPASPCHSPYGRAARPSPTLDPPSRERRVQLDEREVSDETVVEAAETPGRDHTDPDHGPMPRSRVSRFRTTSVEVVQALEVDRRGEPVQRGCALLREAEAPELDRREPP